MFQRRKVGSSTGRLRIESRGQSTHSFITTVTSHSQFDKGNAQVVEAGGMST